MMILLVFFLVTPSFSASQKYTFKDSKLTDEFVNVYKYLNNPKGIPSFTKAELLTITPRKAGEPFYCSDCTTDGIVVSTAVAPGGFGRISSRTTVIN